MHEFSQLLEQTKHKSVSNIPGFPAKSFSELLSTVETGAISIGVDRTSANSLAPTVSGLAYLVWISFLMIAPFAVALLVPIWGIFAGRYHLLLGAPVALVTVLAANPFNSARRGMTMIGLAAIVALCIAVAASSAAVAWLLFAFAGPFWAVRMMYYSNTLRLISATQRSEALFLYLFERGICTVRDNATGRIHSI